MSSALARSAVEQAQDGAQEPARQVDGTIDTSTCETLDPVATLAVEQARDTDGRFSTGLVPVPQPDSFTVVDAEGKERIMRPQPHGGALLTGGKVGGGKYADEVRRYSRAELLDMLPELIQKAKASQLRHRDHIKLAELLARIGIPQQSESLNLEEGRRMLQRVVGSIIDAALLHGVPRDVVDGWYRRAVEEMEADV